VGSGAVALGRGPLGSPLIVRATVGQLGNVEHSSVHNGKAGRTAGSVGVPTIVASP